MYRYGGNWIAASPHPGAEGVGFTSWWISSDSSCSISGPICRGLGAGLGWDATRRLSSLGFDLSLAHQAILISEGKEGLRLVWLYALTFHITSYVLHREIPARCLVGYFGVDRWQGGSSPCYFYSTVNSITRLSKHWIKLTTQSFKVKTRETTSY